MVLATRFAVSLLLALTVGLNASCQFQIYETLEDYNNGTPKDYSEYEFVKTKGVTDVKMTIRNPSSKEEFVIDCSRVWGFTYKGNLLRNLRENEFGYEYLKGCPMLLMWDGEVCTWMNGTTVYTMAKSDSDAPQGYPHLTVPYFFSRTRTSAMIPMPEKLGEDKKTIAIWEKFFRENQDLRWLQDCAQAKKKNSYTYLVLRNCLAEAIRSGSLKMTAYPD